MIFLPNTQQRARTRRRPTVNWASLQARGLVDAYPGGALAGLVMKEALSLRNNPTVEADPFGLYYDVDGTGTSSPDYYITPALPMALPCSVSLWFRMAANPSAARTIVASSGHNDGDYHGLSIHINTDGTWVGRMGRGGSTSTHRNDASTGSAIPLGAIVHLLAVVRGRDNWSVFQNARAMSPTFSGTASSIVNATVGGSIGDGPVNQGHAVDVFDLRWGNADWSSLAWHLYDPRTRWDLYAAAPKRVYVDVGAAPVSFLPRMNSPRRSVRHLLVR